jgi:hypothetical protein
MRFEKFMVRSRELRFLSGGRIDMDDVLLGRPVDHSVSNRESFGFDVGGIGSDELLYGRLHSRFRRLIAAVAFCRLSDSFLCMQMMCQSILLWVVVPKTQILNIVP